MEQEEGCEAVKDTQKYSDPEDEKAWYSYRVQKGKYRRIFLIGKEFHINGSLMDIMVNPMLTQVFILLYSAPDKFGL